MQSQAQSVAAASGAKLMYTTHNAMRGAAITGDAAQIRALAERLMWSVFADYRKGAYELR